MHAGFEDFEDGGDGSDGVGDVVGSVGKSDIAGADDLEGDEEFFYGMVIGGVLGEVRFFAELGGEGFEVVEDGDNLGIHFGGGCNADALEVFDGFIKAEDGVGAGDGCRCGP